MSNPIAQRLFLLDGKEAHCSFFAPEADGADYRCRYEIEWPEGTRSRYVFGVDAVQALFLAMGRAHIDLLAARENDGRKVTWNEQEALGLPANASIAHWVSDPS